MNLGSIFDDLWYHFGWIWEAHGILLCTFGYAVGSVVEVPVGAALEAAAGTIGKVALDPAVAAAAAGDAAVGAAVEADGSILDGLGVALGLLLHRSSHERASRSLAETGLCFRCLSGYA